VVSSNACDFAPIATRCREPIDRVASYEPAVHAQSCAPPRSPLTKHTILFLAANPVGTDRLALDREARAIQVELERSGHRDQLELVTRWAAEPLDLLRELRKLRPTVVHFSGHGGQAEMPSVLSRRRDVVNDGGADEGDDGDNQHGLFLQGPDGRPQLVPSAALAETFGAAGTSVKLVVLNACYSEMQAEGLLAHVGCVVGITGSISDDAARSFAIGFYGGLGERESVAAAHRQGCAAIRLEGLRDSDRPQLRVRDGLDAARLFLAENIQIFVISMSRVAAATVGVSVIGAALLSGLAVGVNASEFPTKGFLGVLGVGAMLVMLAITANRLPREQTGSIVKWLATLITMLIAVLAFAGVYGFAEALSSPSVFDRAAADDGEAHRVDALSNAGDGSSGQDATREQANPRADTTGVTSSEIKIGQSMPYSGPASAYGTIGKAEAGYFKMINEKGGINGRNINLISLDDGYHSAKAVEQAHKLVENEKVAFVFSSVGTANNIAVQKYLNDKKVPQLFVMSGVDRWSDPERFPWTIGWQLSYRIESQIYAKYLMKEKPGARMCVLYQNDDFGKEYLKGLQEGFGDQFDKIVIKTASYEATDPTPDAQIVTLQGAGCDTLLVAASPKFAAQAIRKVADIGWKPLFFMSNGSTSLAAVLNPAGTEKSVGIITGVYTKDPSDSAMANDPGMIEYRNWAKQYIPDIDPTDVNAVYGFALAGTLVQVLKACGDDLSRANIMKQAASLHHVKVPVLIDGIEMNTSADDFRPLQQLQLRRFDGAKFNSFGSVLSID
jgi:branched-chain amino acid transport system substrate-binding protein